MDHCIVLSTASSSEEAAKIARALVERRLAACVNIVPGIRSIYWWQGKVDEAAELLLVIKTTKAQVAAIKQAIRELHTYDVPECVVVAISDGSPEYLKWITESVR